MTTSTFGRDGQKAGVPVCITPEGTSVGVSEHVILIALSLLKNLRSLDGTVRSGSWPVWSHRSTSYELAGKVFGIVGSGRVGREVALRVSAFGCSVVYYDESRSAEVDERRFQVSYLPLPSLLSTADIVSLHLPLSPTTQGIVDSRFLGSMKPTALLINTARGELVEEASLIDALRNGTIAGAGLDVLRKEPPDPRNELLDLPNVEVTPHVAAGTRDAFLAKLEAIFANMRRVA